MTPRGAPGSTGPETAGCSPSSWPCLQPLACQGVALPREISSNVQEAAAGSARARRSMRFPASSGALALTANAIALARTGHPPLERCLTPAVLAVPEGGNARPGDLLGQGLRHVLELPGAQPAEVVIHSAMMPPRLSPDRPTEHFPDRASACPADSRGLTSPATSLTPHQSERRMSVTSVVSASFQRRDIARNAHTAHNAHAQNRRSGALRHRFEDGDTLHMVRHRKQIERPQHPHPIPPLPEIPQIPRQRRRIASHIRDPARAQ